MENYYPIFLVIILGIVIASVFTILGIFLGPKRVNPAKELPFESGMIAKGDAKSKVNIRFYLVAMAFLVFDVEVAFFYPWAILFKENSLNALIAILPFLVLLLIGLLYDWKKGALEWE